MNVFIDIETYSEVDLAKCGAYRYVEDSSFEILLISYAIDDQPVKTIDCTFEPDYSELLPLLMDTPFAADITGDLEKPIRRREAINLHAHNANFERIALNKHFGIEIPIERWHCTMSLAASCGLPFSLDKVSEVMKLENAKMKEGKALIAYFCKPCKPTKSNGRRTRNLPVHAPEKWENFIRYCEIDVEAEREIYNRLKRNQPTDFERSIYILDQRINDRGVMVDQELAAAAVAIDTKHKEALTGRVIELTGVSNPGSRSQLIEWLEGQMDREITTLRKEDIPVLLKETDCDIISEVLEARQGLSKTSTSKYKAMLNGVCSDGRIRGLLQYYGANRTGRFAGRLVQIQNLPQNHLADLDFARELAKAEDLEGVIMYYLNPSDTLSQLIRTAFVPAEGKVLGVADFAQIEARVIAWLAGERWRIEAFEKGQDIYRLSAAMMFHIPVETIAKDSDYRKKGKVAELACGFGGGVGALERMDSSGVLSKDEMQTIIDNWRKASPRIVRFWYNVDQAFKDALRTGQPQVVKIPNTYQKLVFRYEMGCLTIQLPSKRKLFYWKPSFTQNRFGSESVQYWGMGQTTKKWVLIETYGGKLTENIVQAIARDLLVSVMERVDGVYPIVMHIHDELVSELNRETAENDLKEIYEVMATVPEWAAGLPTKGEGFLSDYYKKD